MRRVLLGDLLAGARALARAAPAQRPALAARWLAESDAAHRYMKRFGRPHAAWGSGSLESHAGLVGLAGLAPQVGADLAHPDVLDALSLLARALCLRAQALPCRPAAPCDRVE